MSFEKDLRVDKADGTDLTIASVTNPGEGSRIATQDRRSGDQQLPAPDTHRNSAEVRSEQLGHNAPDLHTTEKDSKTRNGKEQEDQGPDVHSVQQPSEAASERTLGGGQDGGDADPVQSRGKSWCPGRTR